METKKILLVDDETQITRTLKRSLMAHRYDVRAAADGESGLDLFFDWSPDLVTTDLLMPEMGGIELCRKLRETSQIPIIVLSVKDEEKSKVEVLDAGVDNIRDEAVRHRRIARAALRRAPVGATAEVELQLSAGDFFVNTETHPAFVRGAEVHLTPKEFDLLVYLMKNPEKVLTHRTILAATWGANFTEQPEYLRVFLDNLRRKIEPKPAAPRYIITEPWVGYRFNPSQFQFQFYALELNRFSLRCRCPPIFTNRRSTHLSRPVSEFKVFTNIL